MKKIFLLLTAFLFVVLSPDADKVFGQKNNLRERLTSGKWVNKAGGYIPNAMGVSDARVERYKIYNFDPDGTFTMDSIKQRYSGNWEIEGDRVIMNFNPKAVAVFKKNMDPNDLVTTYVSEDKVVELGERTAVIENDLLNFGSEESNAVRNSSATAGIKSFWEYTGFANASRGNLIMILIALIFIFLAIKYEYEPLLLIPIGMGIIIGNIPFYMAEGFNLKLGIYEPGSVFNIL